MEKKELKIGKNDFLLKDTIGGVLISLFFIIGSIVLFGCLFADVIEKTEVGLWFLAAFILFIGTAFLYSKIEDIKKLRKGNYVIYKLPVKEKKIEKVRSRNNNRSIKNGPNLHRYVTFYILLFDVEGKEEIAFVSKGVYQAANIGSSFYVVVVEGHSPVCYAMDTYYLSSKDQQHLRG